MKNANSHVSRAMAFAHPVDAGIIRVLDFPLLKRSVESILDDSVDLRFGYQQASGVSLSFRSHPELCSVVAGCADSLHIPMPRVVISGDFGINAVTYGTDNACYIALGSMLNRFFPMEEQTFVIGHECGHIALGHMLYHTLMGYLASLGTALPAVGPVIARTAGLPLAHWSRCSEISADRAGLICCKDPSAAKRALYHIAAGLSDVSDADNTVIDDYVENAKSFLEDNCFGKYREILLEHPLLSKRIEALDLFSRSEKYYRAIGRPISPGRKLISDEVLEKKTAEILRVR